MYIAITLDLAKTDMKNEKFLKSIMKSYENQRNRPCFADNFFLNF